MGFRFTCEHPVRWKDIDAARVLNNAVYLSLVEQARFEYFHELDLLADEQVPFLLGETTIRFLKPGRAGMKLTIGARVLRLGGKSFDMDYEIRHGDEILATVRAVLVYADPVTLQTRTIPSHFRRRISMFEGIPEKDLGRGGS
jgi:acyl-CoA thioester hydrolase